MADEAMEVGMGVVEQMQAALTMIDNMVAELRDAGVDGLTIAAAMNAKAGGLYRDAFPDARERRSVILHAAEVAITGRAQEMG